jgi:hypothetical protein
MQYVNTRSIYRLLTVPTSMLQSSPNHSFLAAHAGEGERELGTCNEIPLDLMLILELCGALCLVSHCLCALLCFSPSCTPGVIGGVVILPFMSQLV